MTVSYIASLALTGEQNEGQEDLEVVVEAENVDDSLLADRQEGHRVQVVQGHQHVRVIHLLLQRVCEIFVRVSQNLYLCIIYILCSLKISIE